jgi:hypothetical protein
MLLVCVILSTVRNQTLPARRESRCFEIVELLRLQLVEKCGEMQLLTGSTGKARFAERDAFGDRQLNPAQLQHLDLLLCRHQCAS